LTVQKPCPRARAQTTGKRQPRCLFCRCPGDKIAERFAERSRRRENGSRVMTVIARLNRVIAYVVFAFVGAIVLGLV
jgi:hypothetical protein